MQSARSIFKNSITENLMDSYPPFQIDGHLGYTVGVCEMLLASHSGYVELLPALPKEWENGSFKGLVARGAFVVDCEWRGGKVEECKILSRVGGTLKFKLPCGIAPRGAVGDIRDGIFVLEMRQGDEISLGKS